MSAVLPKRWGNPYLSQSRSYSYSTSPHFVQRQNRTPASPQLAVDAGFSSDSVSWHAPTMARGNHPFHHHSPSPGFCKFRSSGNLPIIHLPLTPEFLNMLRKIIMDCLTYRAERFVTRRG